MLGQPWSSTVSFIFTFFPPSLQRLTRDSCITISCHRHQRDFGDTTYPRSREVVAPDKGTPSKRSYFGRQILLHISDAWQILWVASHVWPPAITALKISILCFYRSIFPIPWFIKTTYVLMSVCALWLFSGFWVILFQCTPIRAVYDFSPAVQANKHCVEFGQFVFFYELLNACIDVAILALPAFIVPRLQLSTPRKVQVMAIFLLGGL